MDVEVAGVARSNHPEGGGRFGVLRYQILSDVHSQLLQLGEMGQLLLVQLPLGLWTKMIMLKYTA